MNLYKRSQSSNGIMFFQSQKRIVGYQNVVIIRQVYGK